MQTPSIMSTRRLVALSLTSLLAACTLEEAEEPIAVAASALESSNALTTNALTSNALTSNALTSNALTSNALTSNALTSNALTSNALATDATARELLKYVYSCALPAGTSMTLTFDGLDYVFDGQLGLAATWGTGGCDASCQRWVSACVLARVNAFGIPVALSLRGPHPALMGVTAAESEFFTYQEGAFFGNIFDASGARYACNGAAYTSKQLSSRLCASGGVDCAIQTLGGCEATIQGSVHRCDKLGRSFIDADGAFHNCRLDRWVTYPETITVYTQDPSMPTDAYDAY